MVLRWILLLLLLPLFIPMGLLFLVKGAMGLRTGRFELYTVACEGTSARLMGMLVIFLALVLLGCCLLLVLQASGA